MGRAWRQWWRPLAVPQGKHRVMRAWWTTEARSGKSGWFKRHEACWGHGVIATPGLRIADSVPRRESLKEQSPDTQAPGPSGTEQEGVVASSVCSCSFFVEFLEPNRPRTLPKQSSAQERPNAHSKTPPASACYPWPRHWPSNHPVHGHLSVFLFLYPLQAWGDLTQQVQSKK